MTTDRIKKYILPYIPYVLLLWFFSKLAKAYRLVPGDDTLHRIIGSITNLGESLSLPMSAFYPMDLLFGLIATTAAYCFVLYKKKNAKKWRKDIEYGSARWGA
jgi:type IV secretion system protein VirD4